MVLNTAVLERIGLRVQPEELARLIEEALEQVLPSTPAVDPRHDLTSEEVGVLIEGGALLHPPARGADSPLVRTAAEYAALLASALTVLQSAERMGVDGSRVRQRLAAHTLYGIKHGASWRLPLFQFTADGLVPGFEQVAPRLAGVHPVAVSRWFTQPHVDLSVDEDETPVAPRIWLMLGHDPAAVAGLADELRAGA